MSRPTLREAQRRLAALILPGSATDGVTADAESLLAVPPGDTIANRLQAYAHGYPARLHEALAETFPAVAHAVGAEHFGALTERYAQAVPLRSYNLSDAGERLAEFLRDDLLRGHLPFLPDLAALDWHVARAFHAHEQPPLDPAPLASWTMEQWERARFSFQPSVAIVLSDWPIREIWQARSTPVENIDIDLENRPDHVLVRRSGFTVQCDSISLGEAAALRALLRGRTLGEIGELPECQTGDPEWVSAAFARWMAAGMITTCVAAGS